MTLVVSVGTFAFDPPWDAALDGAKAYVHTALARGAAWRLGGGHGPLGWPTSAGRE